MRYHMLKAGLLSGFMLFLPPLRRQPAEQEVLLKRVARLVMSERGGRNSTGTARKQCLILPAVLSVPYQERQGDPAAIPRAR